MSKLKITTNSTGISMSVLATIFIVLKLTNNISWSWWYVLMPIWLPMLGTVVVVLVAAGLAIYVEWDKMKTNERAINRKR